MSSATSQCYSLPTQPQSHAQRVRRHIRPGTPGDMQHLKPIEDAADLLFIDRFSPHHWDQADGPAERMAHGGWVLVAVCAGADEPGEDAPVGFVHVLDPALAFSNPPTSNPSKRAHIEALAVHPNYARQGYGRALVAAAVADARERGYTSISLRTYADVPWNGPFYSSCGFREVDAEEVERSREGGHGEQEVDERVRAFYAACVEKEAAMGLMQYGRRVLMLMLMEL